MQKLFTATILCLLLLAKTGTVTAQHEYYASCAYTYGVPMSEGGMLFKLDSLAKKTTTVHNFNTASGGYALGSVIQATNGKIYGLTTQGGMYTNGTLFEYDPVLDSFQVKLDMPLSCSYGIIQASNGKLYYTTTDGADGYLTEYDISANTLTQLQYLPYPQFPTSALTEVSGKLYGITQLGGTYGRGSMYEYNLTTGVFNYVYSYVPTSGCQPGTQPVYMASTGLLYGAAILLPSKDGVLYSFNPVTHVYTNLITMPASIGRGGFLTVGANNKIYGYGSYGTDISGNHWGCIFEYDPTSNTMRLTHNFGYQSNGDVTGGNYELGGLTLASNGKMYGNNGTTSFQYDYLKDTVKPGTTLIGEETDTHGYFCEICRKPSYKYYSRVNDTACLGGLFQFDLHNDNALACVWQHNGVTDPTQTTPVLHFASFAKTDTGIWACTLTNQCGVTTPPAIHVALNPLPYSGSITGADSVCAGATIALSDTAGSGIWSSSSPAATVSGGVVTGMTAGTATITYSVSHACGIPTKTITINPLPGSAGAITGASTACIGTTLSLSDAASDGIWASSATGVALAGSTGTITSVSTGTAVISYSVTNSCGSNTATKTVTVTTLPVAGAITGATTICPATPAALTDGITGGMWSSDATAIATVGSTGVVTAVSAGTAVISYTLTNSCGTVAAVKTVTVDLFPVAGTIISFSTTVCTGTSIQLSDATAGGTWSSAATGIATIDNYGVVAGISGGTTTISYTVSNVCGTANAITTITVNPLSVPVAGAITGATTVCGGSVISLSDTAAGGKWYSSMPDIAAVDSTTGVVTGVSKGTVTIIYLVTNSCGSAVATATVTVNSLAGVVTGTNIICTGLTTLLSDTATGGTWHSSAAGIATVSSAGVVTGISAGTAVISYSVSGSCGTTATTTVTVLSSPSAGIITGTTSVCQGSTGLLSDGMPGGTWNSADVSIATISSTGIVTGIFPGTATISYSVISCGSLVTAVQTVTVNPTSFIAPAIAGDTTVCAGSTILLSDAMAGGKWYVSVPSIATIDSNTGAVTGVSSGTVTIVYIIINNCGTGYALKTVTVTSSLAGTGSITGGTTLCAGSSTSLSDATAGGTWSSGAISVATAGSAGIITGVAAGTAVISYTIVNGCGTAVATTTVTINPRPVAGVISGASMVCTGAGTLLSNATTGGVWSSSAAGIATVSASGLVTGVSAGTVSISYTVTNGCGNAYAIATITVTTGPVSGTITGATSVCPGATTGLSDAIAGGVWSSSATGVATITGTGVVTGVSAGTAVISYSVTTGCGSAVGTATITVNPMPATGTIAGAGGVCAGATTLLSDRTAGGVWNSGATGVATVSVTGMVTGVSAGSAIISYSVTNSCGTAIATTTLTVTPLPFAGTITGSSVVCAGASISLSDAVAGGVWSISNTAATISGSVISAVSAGIDTVSYTVTNSCGTDVALMTITITALPAAGAITGSSKVCTGEVIPLSDPAIGGAWNTSDIRIATVNALGTVTGISAGTVIIDYTVTNSCGSATVSASVTVLSLAECTEAVDTRSSTTGLKLYPNPSNGSFTAEVFSPAEEDVLITISNVAGQKIKTFTGRTNASLNIMIENSAGIYLLSATTPGNNYEAKMIVIK